MDFVAFDALHRKHHAHVGDEYDPQLLDYSVFDGTTRTQLGWHLLRPLTGWNSLHLLTLVKQRMSMKRPWLVSVGEFIGLVSVQAGFFYRHGWRQLSVTWSDIADCSSDCRLNNVSSTWFLLAWLKPIIRLHIIDSIKQV